MAPKHYRPPGKKKEGNAAKYITRTKAVKYLQVTLQNFRKLCILKGIAPRDPKKKLEGSHKTYYYMKDIMFIAHDPLVRILREKRSHRKKITKALGKKNKDLAQRLIERAPKYKLDRNVLERFPTFESALQNLDDCLTMTHLFAKIPAIVGERLEVDSIHKCRRLSHEWQAYVSRTHKLRKTYISGKGIYYQAEIRGVKITWLTPHDLQQNLTNDVDMNVMLSFLEFHEAHLGFVLFKLYHSIGLTYPPLLDPKLEALAAELYAISRYIGAAPKTSSEDSKAITSEKEDNTDSIGVKESDLRLAQLQHQLPANEPGTLMRLVKDTSVTDDDDDDDEETKLCKNLFRDLKVFLGREVPRESFLFIIPAFGGTVSWDGPGAPFDEADESITHQVVDRPTQGHIYLSREYVAPQWIFDCANARVLIPTEAYLLGRIPPPHLSPFVDNEAEGYIPDYAKLIKSYQEEAKKHDVLPLPDLGDGDFADVEKLMAGAVLERAEASVAAENARKLKEEEKKYLDEVKKELQGITYSASMSENKGSEELSENNKDSPDVEEKSKQDSDDDTKLTKLAMTRKKRGLYEAIQIGAERKKEKTRILEERKKKLKTSGKKA